MKKIFSLLVLLILLSGCSMGKDMLNTPTKKVEEYLDSYQKLDDNVLNDLDTLIEDTDYTVEQRARYREIMKKHYSNLSYEIKDEAIDGDNATVDVEIEVTDYSSIMSEEIDEKKYLDEKGEYDPSKYFDYQLSRLEKADEKVKYTITFNLTKENDNWVIDNLDNKSMEKIHGIYIQ